MSLELTAREILETGNLRQFEEYMVANADKIDSNYVFEEQVNFLFILVQTFRKVESQLVDKHQKSPVEDYKNAMSFLVETGCDINKKDSLGRSVGHWTILLKALELLSVCLRLAFDTSLQDNDGQTIVHLAIRHIDAIALETIKVYAKDPLVLELPSITSGATPLIYAVQIGAVEIVSKLLQLSVDINAQENNKYKRTALHYSLFTNNEDIFELLLKNKAKTDIRDHRNKTVVDKAAEHPKDSFLKMITHYSAPENSPSGDNQTTEFSPIMTACKNNDFEKLCEIIKTNEGKDQKILLKLDADRRGALHYCSDNDDERCAAKLIELASELLNQKDKNGFVPLHLATISNNVKLVNLLLDSNCDAKEQDSEGHTSLHWAVICCNLEILEILMAKAPQIVRIGDTFGASPLHYATQSFLNSDGSTPGPMITEELLKHEEADINCTDKENRTPLLWAACLGIPTCLQLLLEKGANINHRDNKGLSTLHCAASRGHYEIVEILVNSWSMSLEGEDNNLCTPLFYAVTLNHKEIINFLLGKRCNPNQRDVKGRSVAHCAALKGYCDVLGLIHSAGGSLCLQNKDGDLPLHEAAETGNLEVCRFLLDKMEECNEISLVNSVNLVGQTPLHKAAVNNHGDICELLLGHGADRGMMAKVNSGENEVSALDLAKDAATIAVLKNSGITIKKTKDPITATNNEVVGGRRKKTILRRSISLNVDKGNPRLALMHTKIDFKSLENIRISDNLNSSSVEDKESEDTREAEKVSVQTPLRSEVREKEPKMRIQKRNKERRPSPPQNITTPRSSATKYVSKITKNSSNVRNIDRKNDYYKFRNNQSAKVRNIRSEPANKDSETISLYQESSCTVNLRSNDKSTQLNQRVINSVKEYVSIRDRMRAMSNQRRMEMFEGFNKSAKLNKLQTKSTDATKSVKQNRYSPTSSTDVMELPQITSADARVSRRPRIGQMTSEEQIKSAYQSDSTLTTLILY